MAAVTWAASAPSFASVKRAANGNTALTGARVFASLPNENNCRRVLTKLTATGDYVTGGATLSPATFGLKTVVRAFVVADATAATLPAATGVPCFDLTDPLNPKLKIGAAAGELTASTITGATFHVILEGV